MRRRFIALVLLANALAGGLVLLLLANDGGWGNAVQLSAPEAVVLTVVAAVAFGLNLLLGPVLAVSAWARDRQAPRPAAPASPRPAWPRDEPAT
jgi:hypothetical protein